MFSMTYTRKKTFMLHHKRDTSVAISTAPHFSTKGCSNVNTSVSAYFKLQLHV